MWIDETYTTCVLNPIGYVKTIVLSTFPHCVYAPIAIALIAFLPLESHTLGVILTTHADTDIALYAGLSADPLLLAKALYILAASGKVTLVFPGVIVVDTHCLPTNHYGFYVAA